ncbi:MAG: glycosyltransferase, partial [Synechococcaceae cyanobacterium]|nr:glycosyltransferase [Synechococcaceae cyanobacterium]
MKPVEGANPRTDEAFASFCRQTYAGPTELIVGTVSESDPIVPVVHRLQQTFPDHRIRIVYAPLLGTNRKTSIMQALWREAEGDYLFFSDADVLVEPDYLERLVTEFRSPAVGCVTCLPRGVCAETVGGRWIALHYDFSYLPQWMLARRTTGISWAIGHTMAVRRSVLEQLNGFLGFLNHLADDYELGHRTTLLGFQVQVPPVLLDCTMPQETPLQTFRRLIRWKRTMRRARGIAFLGVGLTYPVFWATVLTAINPLTLWAWATLGCTVLLRLLLAGRLQRQVQLPDWRRAWYWLPLLDLIEGLTFLG